MKQLFDEGRVSFRAVREIFRQIPHAVKWNCFTAASPVSPCRHDWFPVFVLSETTDGIEVL